MPVLCAAGQKLGWHHLYQASRRKGSCRCDCRKRGSRQPVPSHCRCRRTRHHGRYCLGFLWAPRPRFEMRRRHRHQRKNNHDLPGPPHLRARRTTLRADWNDQIYRCGRRTPRTPHDARVDRHPENPLRNPGHQRTRRGHGSLEPRHRAKPRERHRIRCSGLHESHTGPSRLSRLNGCLLRSEGRAFRGARIPEAQEGPRDCESR